MENREETVLCHFLYCCTKWWQFPRRPRVCSSEPFTPEVSDKATTRPNGINVLEGQERCVLLLDPEMRFGWCAARRNMSSP